METSLAFYSVMGYLAVYRLTYMIVRDEGPFEFFERVRGLFTGNDWMARGIRCPYCVSFWAGLSMAPLTFLAANSNPAAIIVLLGLGLSGAFTLTLDLMRAK